MHNTCTCRALLLPCSCCFLPALFFWFRRCFRMKRFACFCPLRELSIFVFLDCCCCCFYGFLSQIIRPHGFITLCLWRNFILALTPPFGFTFVLCVCVCVSFADFKWTISSIFTHRNNIFVRISVLVYLQYTQAVLHSIQNADGTVSIIQVDPNSQIITLPDGTTAQVQGIATVSQPNPLHLSIRIPGKKT